MIRRFFIVCFILLFYTFETTSCTMVDSFKIFSIEKFEILDETNDFNIIKQHIQEGKMDFAKVNNVVFMPFMKEYQHPENENLDCIITIYTYIPDGKASVITINYIKITMEDGTVICDAKEENLEKGVYKETDGTECYCLTAFFEKTEKWCYNGNQIKLTFQAEVNDGTSKKQKEFSYDIVIKGTKRHVLPT